MNKFDLLITGVGGQGVVLASDIIGEVGLAEGYDVKKTDTLGMAQRGGSVISHVRLAQKVWSPLIKEGEVDIIIAFEKLEAARYSYYLRQGGIAIVNNQSLPPLAVSLGNERYPIDVEIMNILKKRTDQVYFINGTGRAKELGNAKALNVYMLGCVSHFMPIGISLWKDVISQHVPESIRELNIKAFDLGGKEIRGARI